MLTEAEATILFNIDQSIKNKLKLPQAYYGDVKSYHSEVIKTCNSLTKLRTKLLKYSVLEKKVHTHLKQLTDFKKELHALAIKERSELKLEKEEAAIIKKYKAEDFSNRNKERLIKAHKTIKAAKDISYSRYQAEELICMLTGRKRPVDNGYYSLRKTLDDADVFYDSTTGKHVRLVEVTETDN